MTYPKSLAQHDLFPSYGSSSKQVSRSLRYALLKIKGHLVRFSPNWFWRFHTFINGGYFENEISLLPHLCDKNKMSIDVGASYGGYLTFMLPHSLACLGFEPIAENAGFLSRGFRRKNVSIISCGLSDRCGTARLRYAVCHPGFSTIEPTNDFKGKIRHAEAVVTRKIEIRTLDSFQLENIGFIKVDVEGHELEVLLGAENTLKKTRPKLLVEIEERHRRGSVCKVLKYLRELDYQGYYWKNGELMSIDRFDLSKQQDIRRPNDYVRNFIFLPRAIGSDRGGDV